MKLFDRLIDHVVDRVMARAKQNRPSVTVNNVYADVFGQDVKAGIAAAAEEGHRLADTLFSGIAGAAPTVENGKKSA